MTVVIDGTSGITTPGVSNSGSDAITGNQTVAGTSKFATTIGVGNATPSGSGAGITFPAAQSASSDANTLDDYEEGTFTPTVLGTVSNPTVSYQGNNGGRYIKIGKMVYLQVYLRWLSLTGGSGNMLVGGLPYPVANFTQTIGLSGVTEWSGSYPTSAPYPTPTLESGPGQTFLYVLRSGTSVSSINQALSGLQNADTYLLFGFCYESSN
jgi:hypothetical protein